FELVSNAAGVKSKAAVISSCIYSALMVVILDKNLEEWAFLTSISSFENNVILDKIAANWSSIPYTLTVLYFVIAVILILKHHKDFTLAKIAVFSAMPIVVCYAFSTLGSVINHKNGIYYLLLLLNFSSVCDMGAYFVGVTCGKHKLCPEISPKKTVEGAVGGIVSAIIVGLILVFSFGYGDKLLPTVILTIPLCIIGMLGDLFASAIKRSVGIKDYGALIPGHGGVLDRVDSILLIAPVLYIFVELGVL
ncbi:MAG: phosphatidate cytidylyltransferase, partial [Clostridia bacterium]|nr:phosphatidate cytidylyltransferase [Clostridia bacterium]